MAQAPFPRRNSYEFRFPLTFVGCAILLAWSLPALRAADFDGEIAPLLARRCLSCHNRTDKKGGLDLSTARTALAGGDSGAAFAPGNLAVSLLWERISQDEMPPKKPLPEAEKRLVRDWIAGGAKWGTDPIDLLKYSSDSRAGYDWWSLQPVRRPVLPDVKDDRRTATDLDRFVLARLAQKGLSPAPAADKRTLIRRLSFDLLGLPPEPGEVADFLADESSDAYRKLVDRLLASPRFGERWARHWLDVVRFGESQGFERDKLRPFSWPYRDWVIAAFNSDMAYDRFVQQQIAGDVLHPGDPRAVVATGFLVAGPWDEVGQTQQSAAMKAFVRQDELEDVIAVTSQTFLGLTVNCARCHDHKFDPISQREYYRLAAAFAGMHHGEREVRPPESAAAEAIAALRPPMAGLERQLEGLERPARETVLAERKSQPVPKVELPPALARWEFDADLRDSIGSLHGTAQGKARIEGGKLLLDGVDSYVAAEPLPRELREKTLIVRVALSNLAQRGGGAISVESSSGAVFDAIVFGEKEPRQWLAGSNSFVRTKSFEGAAETDAGTPVEVAIVYGADRSVTAYRNGQAYGEAYQAASLATFEAGNSRILFGLRHSPPANDRFLAGTIDRAVLYDRALSPEQIAALAGVVSERVTEDQLVAALSPETLAERNRIVSELSRLATELRLLSGGRAYAVVPTPAEPTSELIRGNPHQKGERVGAGGIHSLTCLPDDFGLALDAPEGERRVKLAQWITDPRNPLTARVIVNRLWLHHFESGLVETPNDFGFNGGQPSHPQLLDWLAAELIEPTMAPGEREKPAPWSLKHIHRLIVSSATYRQSSRVNPEAMKVDAGNRLLWRRSPQRLEAEAIRDAMLAAAGILNPKMGGPGFQDFRTFTNNSQFYEMLDPVGYEFQRRTVYRQWVRSGRSEFLDAFDCPDPSTTAPRRAVTTTPLQALALFNNSFTLRMAERLAERVTNEGGADPAARIRRLYDVTLSRLPTETELQSAADFVSHHGLPACCRVLLNSNEFLYVD